MMEDRKAYLHFIGRGLYTPKSFIREAKKFGVRRAIPISILKGMEWGTPIYLATYDKQNQRAIVFGYFTVDTISHNLPQECRAKLILKLKVVNSISTNVRVSRACGSYTLSGITYVEDSLKEVAEKIEEVAKECGVKVKVFVGGHLRVFPQPYIIEDIRFFRGYKRIDLELVKGGIEEKTKVEHFENYKQKFWLKKSEKMALLAEDLTQWL